MVLYKGIEINDSLSGLIRYMGRAEEYRETLQTLQAVWDNLTLLGQLAGTGTDMSSTRHAFNRLTSDLLNNLGSETLRKAAVAMRSKAQVVIDMLVRNLYERTADIGFLARDEDIRFYLSRSTELRYSQDPTAEQEMAQLNQALHVRFLEYVSKYSVYFDVVLLSTDGTVLVRLDDTVGVETTRESFLAETLNTDDPFVETYGPSELFPGRGSVLMYSCRVSAYDHGPPAGVVCLCFRFEDEMERIFHSLEDDDDWAVMLLLSPEGLVLSSSDPYHIPLGARLLAAPDADSHVVRFAGREYLATTCPTNGYQGYGGPGWYGHVMMPLDHAFDKDVSALLERVEPDILRAVMGSSTLFGEKLRRIPVQAEQIQAELNRTVWNGNVRQSSDKAAANPAFSKILLWEVANTGLKTKDVFEQSIGNLNATVISAILQDSQLMASLAMNLMDRNLYERANDCRWWALTSYFRARLAEPTQSKEVQAQCSRVLAYLNSLYTVYRNIVLFDRKGTVVAVSNAEKRKLIGTTLSEDWVRPCLGLRTTQAYCVSSFGPTSLAGGRSTYIYAAALHDPADPSRSVGGVAVVFDAEKQFAAMLHDAMPRDELGDEIKGGFGMFVDGQKKIIASTSEDFPVGSSLAIEGSFFALERGQGTATIIIHDDYYYALGARRSEGYREYKSKDDPYQNDVFALIFVPLGHVEELSTKRARTAERPRLQINAHSGGRNEVVEYATFYVGNGWFGIRSDHVVEAVNAESIICAPGGAKFLVGYSLFRGTPIPVIDLAVLMRGEASVQRAVTQMIVVRGILEKDIFFGVVIDALGEIPEIPRDRIESLSGLGGSDSSLIAGIAKLDNMGEHTEMLLLLSPEQIVAGAHEMPDIQALRDSMRGH